MSAAVAWAASSTRGTSSQVFCHHRAGSASAHPACGELSPAGADAWATTPEAGSASTALVPVVPTSSPRTSEAIEWP